MFTLNAKETCMPYEQKPGELLEHWLVLLGNEHAKCIMLVKEELQQLGSVKA